MSIAIYAPAIALSSLTFVPLWAFILSVGLVSTFYTSVGGLKAVVWTDTFQAILMFMGILILIVKVTIDSGGPDEVMKEVSVHGRLKPLTNIDPSPLQYFSLWIAFFGGLAFWLSQYGVSQMAMQRYCSLSSQRQACTVIAVAAPSYLVLVSLACGIGLVMFAYFKHCDPRLSGDIQKQDQMVILMVGRSLGDFPGLPGVFLAALCSGTLSTLSSGINSLTAVTFEDFLSPILKKHCSDSQISRSVKWTSLCFGVVATAMAFACDSLGGLLKAGVSVMGTLAGPLAGLFCLGVLIPRANKFGAIFSVLLTEAFLLWICIGNHTENPYGDYRLEAFADNCANNLTISVPRNTSSSGLIYGSSRLKSVYGDTNVFFLYRISAWLYCLLGIFMVVILGGLVSLFIPDKTLHPQLSDDKTPERKLLTIFDVCAASHSSMILQNAQEHFL